MTYRILVTGSRLWADRYRVETAIREVCVRQGWKNTVVICGAATGADMCAAVSARAMGLRVEQHTADWQRHGKAAGPLRNQAMVDAGADLCLAFMLPCPRSDCGVAPRPHDSHGATDCVRRAEAAGIPVREFRPHPRDAAGGPNPAGGYADTPEGAADDLRAT